MFPWVKQADLVGRYPAMAKSGGGYVRDEVLEYRVWCSPLDGAEDLEDGSDYFYAFATYEEALAFSTRTRGSNEPIALVLQEEYIDEPEPGRYEHIRQQRITEWAVEFLIRPRRNKDTIPDFMSPDAPGNRLDIIRGRAKPG